MYVKVVVLSYNYGFWEQKGGKTMNKIYRRI